MHSLPNGVFSFPLSGCLKEGGGRRWLRPEGWVTTATVCCSKSVSVFLPPALPSP